MHSKQTRHLILISIASLGASMLTPRAALAAAPDVPYSIAFSGTLNSATTNAPENGTFPMIFTLSIGGVAVWCAQYDSVNVTEGQFSVILGGGLQGAQGLVAPGCSSVNAADLPINPALFSAVTSASSILLSLQVSPDGGTTWEAMSNPFPMASSLFAMQTNLAQTATNAQGLQGFPVSATAPLGGQVLEYNGAQWAPAAAGGGGTPAGTNGQVQFNNSGAFGAGANLTFDNSNNVLTIDASTAPSADALVVANNPHGSGTSSLLRLGPSDISGGNGSGTYIGVNAAGGYAGDLMNFEVANATKFKVDASGNVTANGNVTFNGGGTEAVAINNSGTGNTAIGTGSNSGTVTIGNASNSVALGGPVTQAGSSSPSPETLRRPSEQVQETRLSDRARVPSPSEMPQVALRSMPTWASAELPQLSQASTSTRLGRRPWSVLGVWW